MKKRANRRISKKSLEAEERRLKRIKNQCGKWLLSMSVIWSHEKGRNRGARESCDRDGSRWKLKWEHWKRPNTWRKEGEQTKEDKCSRVKILFIKKLWEGIHVYGREIQLTRNRNKSIPSKWINNIGQRKRNTKAWRKKVPEQRKTEKFRDWRGGEKIWEREEV